MSRVEELLDRVRRSLARMNPIEAASAVEAKWLLIDIRPSEQRASLGEIAGAVVIDRTVLVWRLDPTSPDRHPKVDPERPRAIVLCQEGYASSLAAATLRNLGVEATDLIGGFAAWQRSGLPLALKEAIRS